MPRRARSQIATILMGACALAAPLALAADEPPASSAPASSAPASSARPASSAPAPSAAAVSAAAGSVAAPPAPMSAAEVIQMLDETVDWYRTLGAQQQIADEPSDLLILSENRQIANHVVGLAFEVARASADQLVDSATSAASVNQAMTRRKRSPRGSTSSTRRCCPYSRRSIRRARELGGCAQEGPARVASQGRRAAGRARSPQRQEKHARQHRHRGERQRATDVSSLRSQIDAMAVALPGTTSGAPQPAAAPAAQHSAGTRGTRALRPQPRVSASGMRPRTYSSSPRRLPRSTRSSGARDALQSALMQIQSKLVEQLRALSARGDALMAQADTADSAAPGVTRDQLDALANQFKQASVLFVPLRSRQRSSINTGATLKNWRDAVEGQSRSALKSLGIRAGVLAAHPGRGVRPRRAVASRRAQIRAGFAPALSALAAAQDRALDSGGHHHRVHLRERARLDRDLRRSDHRGSGGRDAERARLHRRLLLPDRKIRDSRRRPGADRRGERRDHRARNGAHVFDGVGGPTASLGPDGTRRRIPQLRGVSSHDRPVQADSGRELRLA